MILTKKYQGRDSVRGDVITNWNGRMLTPALYYCHRCTDYTKDTYPIGLHFHDYTELVIVAGGDIRYMCENTSRIMKPWEAVLVPGGQMHASQIMTDSTRYDRHVFYFYPHSLDDWGGGALMEPLMKLDSPYLSLSGENRGRLQMLLGSLEEVSAGEAPAETACSGALIMALFYLFGKDARRQGPGEEWLPEKVAEVRNYVDSHFQEISDVSQVAEHFFYSREHVSRLFRQYAGITVAEYIRKRRVSAAQQWMKEEMSLTDICFRAGFGSLSAFIRAFREETGMTPSEYRKVHIRYV